MGSTAYSNINSKYIVLKLDLTDDEQWVLLEFILE